MAEEIEVVAKVHLHNTVKMFVPTITIQNKIEIQTPIRIPQNNSSNNHLITKAVVQEETTLPRPVILLKITTQEETRREMIHGTTTITTIIAIGMEEEILEVEVAETGVAAAEVVAAAEIMAGVQEEAGNGNIRSNLCIKKITFKK
jgi:hypothetical protein